ncbi:MAG: HAMP domain-containing histidine kinase [Actinomycetota bacterium]|nr:HAMP domain-containing histidine kinase [Actinomycetota bacterium]
MARKPFTRQGGRSRTDGIVARLRGSRRWPSRWPIRWKLAAVSAGLTFIILIAFGAVVGQLTTNQLRENYSADTMSKAEELIVELRQSGVTVTPAFAGSSSTVYSILGSTNGVAELILSGGLVYRLDSSPSLGPFSGPTGVTTHDGRQVATVAFFDPRQTAGPIGWIRYGRSIDRLDASINRIRLSILAGILGATLLAALAGVVLSRRAMRPISTLTTTAGEIARTRDPEVNLDEPEGEDEVAELTRTFSDMLHELSLSRAEEERLLMRQREFVADASHELRTPLTSVLANLELLEESLKREGLADDVESVDSALRSSRRMRRLVADLQILARIDARQDAIFVPCDLSRIAAGAVAELRPLSEKHELILQTAGPVPVSGVEDDLHRVMINLIDNAISHIGAGAAITVATRADPEQNVAVLTVSDNGPGIPEELRGQIFERFVRSTEPGDRSGRKGTGLGLAIVKAISEGHGGAANVGESAAGGAEFKVTLPLGDTLPEGSETASAEPVEDR